MAEDNRKLSGTTLSYGLSSGESFDGPLASVPVSPPADFVASFVANYVALGEARASQHALALFVANFGAN